MFQCLLVLLGLVTFASIYRRVIRTDYFFDDLQAFGGDLDQISLPGIDALWTPQARPLLQLWFWLVSQCGDPAVVAYRLSGLLIHLVNCLLAYHLVSLLPFAFDDHKNTHEQNTASEQRSEWMGLLVATTWMIHPIVPQTICCIVQQAESIATMLEIVYLIAIVKLQSWARGKVAILLQAILVLGLYTKFIVVAVVPAGLLLDAMLQRKSIRVTLRTRWLLHIPPVVVALISVLLLAPTLIRAEGGVGFGGEAPTPWVYLMTSAKSFVQFLGLTVFPLHLSIDRSPQWIINAHSSLPWVLLSGVYFLAAIWFWHHPSNATHMKHRFIGWLLLMPLILLSPTTSFVPTADSFFEHRIYFAMVFWIWLVVLSIDWLIAKVSVVRVGNIRTVFTCILLVAGSALFIRTHVRVKDFETPQSIWRSALLVDASNSRAAQNFVAAMQQAGLGDAIEESLTQIAVNAESRGRPFDATVHQLARIKLQNGQPDAALRILQELNKQGRKLEDCVTVRQRRELGELSFDFALALAQVGKTHDAIMAIEKTIAVSPTDPFVHRFRGDLYHRLGDHEQAQQSWATAESFWKTITEKP